MAAYPTMDDAFRALADPSRRLLLDSLNERNGQTLRELCSRLDMARQSVSKHLAVLEAANLVTTVRRGREKLHYLNPAPINEIAERWITRYEQGRVEALADLKRALEDFPMDQPTFVYTTYIRTTPERLWQALTDPAFTERYWNITFDSDWKTGSPMTWHQRGITTADAEQTVVEADPFRRLAYTWHTFTPEWAAAMDVAEEKRERLAAERRSKVAFDIEPLDDEQVKLTVVHDDLEPGGLLAGMISNGWPRVLANLKTLLETGEPLPDSMRHVRKATAGLTKS
jgi:DNA-binding transcriptional ArsR family regulator